MSEKQIEKPVLKPTPRAELLPLHVYQPGLSHVDGLQEIFKLSSNETPLGPSPEAIAALQNLAPHMQDYPDGGANLLRTTIAETQGLNKENIICGNGSDEFFPLLASAYLNPGEEAIYSRHGFLVYEIAIVGAGGTPIVAEETNLTADVDKILEKVSHKTRLVFLANPNNPTGTYLPFDEVRRLHNGLPANVILVLDGAYAEYVRCNDYSAGMELVSESENVVMTRTFSKIYGLASLRVGWMYAPRHIIDVLNRIRPPFNVNMAAQLAASAAIADVGHMERAVDHNDKWLTWVTSQLESLGLKVTPSVGNFVLITFTDENSISAAQAYEHLRSKGYILRAVSSYGLPNSLRLTIGTERAMRGVIEVFKEIMQGKI